MESGKHSALKQSSDGSFELVVGEDPVVESTETVAQDSTPSPGAHDTGGSRLKWIVLAAIVLALGAGTVAALSMSGGDDSDADNGAEATGFKPYTGDDEGSGVGTPPEGAIRPVETVRPSAPARRVPDDEPEVVESDVEMVEETDESWKLDENGEEIVESEEVPPDFLDQVAQTEGEIEPGRDGTKLANPKVLKNIREQINRDIEIRKSLPNVKLNARPANLRQRLINPGNATGDEPPQDITVIEDESLENVDEDLQ
jgi:hypothetical protein